MDLYLDHFFKVLDKDGFKSATKVLSKFPNVNIRENASLEESWKGIYLKAEDGSYLEILEESPYWTEEKFGFGLSRFGKEKDVHEQLKNLHPDFDWEQREQFRPDGTPWFKYTQLSSCQEKCFFWAADYQGESAKKPVQQDQSPGIKSFKTLKVKVQKDQISEILKGFRWISPRADRESKIVVPVQGGRTFSIEIDPVPEAKNSFELEVIDLNGDLKSLKFGKAVSKLV